MWRRARGVLRVDSGRDDCWAWPGLYVEEVSRVGLGAWTESGYIVSLVSCASGGVRCARSEKMKKDGGEGA